jgi:hypothetical protein
MAFWMCFLSPGCSGRQCSVWFLETLPHGISFTWLLSLPTWGVDVDGPACPLHYLTASSRQTRGHNFLSGTTLSHRVTVGGGIFSGGVSPQAWIFDGELTIWVPVLLNPT